MLGGLARRASGRHAALAAALALGVLAVGCSGDSDGGRRVLLIGIDGASPRVAMPMVEAGRLPNLADITRRGASGKLRSIPPLFSPRIWATIATGKSPRDHGITAFVKKETSEDKQLYLSHDRRVPALWNIVSERGFSVGVVNWWTTYPPEKINGVMVSDHFFPEQIKMIKQTFKDRHASTGALVHPQSWTARANELFENDAPLTSIADPFTENAALPKWVNREILSRQYETDAEVTRVALGIQQDFRPDVMMVFLPGIDRVSHWLWGNLEPEALYPPGLRPEPAAREAGAEALRRYYEFTDALIGLLARDYDSDDLVLVMSDHGFEAGVSMMLLTGEHETQASLDGVIFARGHGIEAGIGSRGAGVMDVTPTVLAFLGLPTAQDMPGRPGRFLTSDTLDTVQSYDGIRVERVTLKSSGREQEIVEHLRSLGYLEEDDAGGEPDAGAPSE